MIIYLPMRHAWQFSGIYEFAVLMMSPGGKWAGVETVMVG